MTQAAAGAVLRSGYLSHRGTPDEPALAIDLSSSRTRSALWLLAGVRQGLSLGALTGFQFEQQLHEQDLDVYIQPFRDAYPLVGDELHGATANGSVLPPSQVTDGVKLRDAWQSGALAPGSIWGAGLPAAGSPAQAAAVAMLQAINDTLSALSDVSIAESMFQLMRGNYGRAGGILDAVRRWIPCSPRRTCCPCTSRSAACRRTAGAPDMPTIAYTLEQPAPDNWIPLVPVLTSGGTMLLRPGTMDLPGPGNTIIQLAPHAEVLNPGRPFYLTDRVVTPVGVEVQRYPRRTRLPDGSTIMWMARRSGPGRGLGASGLKFDFLRDASPAS